MKRRTLLQATAASATLMAAPMIKAQTLPTGPIRIVVGFPPGGGTDALARVLAQKLQAMWNITIVIDNKAGAGGTIGVDAALKAPPDGYTFALAAPGPLAGMPNTPARCKALPPCPKCPNLAL